MIIPEAGGKAHPFNAVLVGVFPNHAFPCALQLLTQLFGDLLPKLSGPGPKQILFKFMSRTKVSSLALSIPRRAKAATGLQSFVAERAHVTQRNTF